MILSMPTMARRCSAALYLLGVFATPARALDFAPCAEPGHAAFDCATLPVPIDRNGVVPGTVDIHVERRRGHAPGLPVLVALAGGPGAAATGAFDDAGVEELGHDMTSLIRGVEVSGTITLAEEQWIASVTVGGRDAVAGSLEFHSDGSVTGRLGDQDVATTLPRAAEAAALRRHIPPIGARLRRGNHGSGAANGALGGGAPVARPLRSAASSSASHRSGCDIKGNINSKGERIYHVPGGRSYGNTVIDSRAGRAVVLFGGRGASRGLAAGDAIVERRAASCPVGRE